MSSSACRVWCVGDGGITKTLWLGCLFVSCVTVPQGRVGRTLCLCLSCGQDSHPNGWLSR